MVVESKMSINYMDKEALTSRIKYCLDMGIVILIIAGLIIVAATAVQMHKTYTHGQITQNVVQQVVDKGYYVELNLSDNSGTGFNVTKGKVPGVLNSKTGGVITLKAAPRYFKGEYYRSPNGGIGSPYSLPTVQY